MFIQFFFWIKWQDNFQTIQFNSIHIYITPKCNEKKWPLTCIILIYCALLVANYYSVSAHDEWKDLQWACLTSNQDLLLLHHHHGIIIIPILPRIVQKFVHLCDILLSQACYWTQVWMKHIRLRWTNNGSNWCNSKVSNSSSIQQIGRVGLSLWQFITTSHLYSFLLLLGVPSLAKSNEYRPMAGASMVLASSSQEVSHRISAPLLHQSLIHAIRVGE